jgi:arsenate reductase
MKSVLVLCTGNACRSQMAEGYLSFYANDMAIVYSAGIEKHGLNPMAVEVMGEDSIDISEATSSLINEVGPQHFNYLLSVCDDAAERLPDYLSYDEHFHYSIPDPAAATGSREERLERFRQVREQLKICMLKFIGRELIEPRPEPAMS